MIRTSISMFILGVSFGAGPCLISCGPLFLSYVIGVKKDILKSLKAYIVFSFARIIVYVLLSILVYFLGKFITERLFSAVSGFIFIAAGCFIMFIALLIALGKNTPNPVCNLLQKKLLENDNKSIFIFGLSVGLAPCAALFALFSYLSLVAKSWGASVTYTLFFGLGTFFSPLILLALFAGAVPKLMQKLKLRPGKLLNYICAAILLFLGLQLARRGF